MRKKFPLERRMKINGIFFSPLLLTLCTFTSVDEAKKKKRQTEHVQYESKTKTHDSPSAETRRKGRPRLHLYTPEFINPIKIVFLFPSWEDCKGRKELKRQPFIF